MLYDVYFRINHPACMVVEANSEDEAKEIAENLLMDMDDKEVFERLVAAMDFYGLEVVNAEEIEQEVIKWDKDQ